MLRASVTTEAADPESLLNVTGSLKSAGINCDSPHCVNEAVGASDGNHRIKFSTDTN